MGVTFEGSLIAYCLIGTVCGLIDLIGIDLSHVLKGRDCRSM